MNACGCNRAGRLLLGALRASMRLHSTQQQVKTQAHIVSSWGRWSKWDQNGGRRIWGEAGRFSSAAFVMGGLSLSALNSMCELKMELIAEGPACGMEEFAAKYETVGHLGRGGSSTVMLAKNRHSGEHVAVKQMDHCQVPCEEIEREIFVMEQLTEEGVEKDSRYIVQLKDVFRSTASTFVVLELVPGCDLFDLVTNACITKLSNGQSKRDTLCRYFCQLLSGIGHVHANGLLHLDLKPDNVLLTSSDFENAELRLADFGAATFSRGDVTRTMRRKTRRARGSINLHTCTGTTAYWPPEMILFKDASRATDMWALGCIMYVLVTGKHPFDRSGCGDLELIEMRILSEEAEFVDCEWEGMEDLKEIVCSLLCKDKLHRMDEESLRSTDLFRQNSEAVVQ